MTLPPFLWGIHCAIRPLSSSPVFNFLFYLIENLNLILLIFRIVFLHRDIFSWIDTYRVHVWFCFWHFPFKPEDIADNLSDCMKVLGRDFFVNFYRRIKRPGGGSR